MDKTLYELVPVSVKPEKEQWYILLNPKRPDEPCPIYFENGNWQEEPFGLTHYLRPLPPPVAEERTFTLAEAMEIWAAGYSAGAWSEFGKNPEAKHDYFLKAFNITLPE